jgi:transposase-like protein
MISLYEQRHTIRAIATKLGMHQREVWRQLAAAGAQRRARGHAGVVLSRTALERLYVRDELSITEVARRFEVPTEAVVRNLRNHGLPRRSRQAPVDRHTLVRLYVDERLAIRAVAGQLGVSSEKVRAELARCSIPIRRPGRPGQRAD